MLTLKKWNGSSWAEESPKVDIATITASGTPSASTTLRGDGSWSTHNPVYYVTGNTTGTTGVWTGTISDITSYYDGLVIAYKIGIDGSGSTTLNINSLGAKTVRRNTGVLTTHLPINTVVLLVYTTISGTGYWVWADYDSDSNYDLRTTGYYLNGDDTTYAYKYIMEGSNGKFYPLTLENTTGTTKTVSTRNFKIGGKFLYSTTTVAANTLTRYYWYDKSQSYSQYTLNQTTGYTQGYPIYIVGIPQSDGSFKLDNSSYTSFFTQTLPTSDDGKIYIHMGYIHDDSYITFDVVHPIYWYKNDKIELYSNYSTYATSAGTLTSLTATVTELNYMDGVTSNVQTQLNGKASSSHTHYNYDVLWNGVPETIASGDYIPMFDASDSKKLKGGLSFGSATTTFLRNDGTWATPSDSTTLTSLGVTSTAAELNILDGATLSTTELNYVDGVTSAIQTQLNAKAPLVSPALTGTPTAPTATTGTNTTQIATTAFVQTAIAGAGALTPDSTEWYYVGRSTDASTNTAITIDSTDLGSAFDFANYDYKFVYDGYTNLEDNDTPYIQLNTDTTAGRHSYVYQRVQITASTTGTETIAAEYGATSTSISTGVSLGTVSTGNSTQYQIEFIISRSRGSSSGIYSYIVRGEGSAVSGEVTQTESTTYSGTCISRFTGGYGNGGSTLTNVYFYHGITAGTTDVNTVYVYRRRK